MTSLEMADPNVFIDREGSIGNESSGRLEDGCDPRLERLRKHKESLVKCLDSTVLVNHLSDILSPEQREKIRKKKDTDGETAGARLLLNNLIELGDHPHLYSRLSGILGAEDHDQALNLLEENEIKTDSFFEEVFDLLRPFVIRLLGVINVELTTRLMNAGCIKRDTKERIDILRGRENDKEAATELLDQVKRLATGWPSKFVSALRAGGEHDDLVKLLSDFLEEPAKEEKLRFEQEHNSPNADNADCCTGSDDPSITSGQRSLDEDDHEEKADESRCTDLTSDILMKSLHFDAPPAYDGTEPTLEAPAEYETILDEPMKPLEIDTTSNEDNQYNVANDTYKSVRYKYDRDLLWKINLIQKFPKPKDWEKIPQIMRRQVPASDYSLQNDENKLDQAVGGQDESHPEKYDTESCKEGAKEGLCLRPYQKTLAQPGIEGKNSLICAPTGSGKTYVAAAIMKAHLEKRPTNKKSKKNTVVFVVCDVALANQQCRMFKKFLSEFKSIELSSDIDDAPAICLVIEEYDIIVLTAQLLVNYMTPKTNEFGIDMDTIGFEKFSMMILDECHHTALGHPYNNMMGNYVDKKINGVDNLPQVLGLTASLGVGKAKRNEDAVKHILTICANLDAQVLCYPDDTTMEQIKKAVYSPDMKTLTVPGRNPDPFLELVSETMSNIERKLQVFCRDGARDLQRSIADAPAEKGSQPYIQWISRVLKPIEESTKLDDLNRQRALKYLKYLQIYNKGLLLNHECRTMDALEYLEKQFATVNRVKVKLQKYDFFSDDEDSDSDGNARNVDGGIEEEKDPEQLWLEQQFKDQEQTFREISLDPHNKNPMLEKLKVMLMEKFDDEHSKIESCGIIFVEKREMTTALCRWITDDEDLKWLYPGPVVGANAKVKEAAGLTTTQTRNLNTIQMFEDGVIKVLVATSVAEEGIDVKKCNFVIRYNKVSNETAMVQSRGRARAFASSYEVLTGGKEGSKKSRKEETNKLREEMMTKAMKVIKSWPNKKYQDFITKYQTKASQSRKVAAALKEQKITDAAMQGTCFLLCKNCKKTLCTGDELRKLAGTHFSVFSNVFKENFIPKHTGSSETFDDVEMIGVVLCVNCEERFGTLGRYKSIKFPLLKIEQLLVSCRQKNGVWYNETCKRWKNFPFHVHDITHEELLQATFWQK